MRLTRIVPILMLVFGPAAYAQSGSAADRAAAATITANDIKKHVTYLASDALRGRDTPSPGLDSAASYIAREFAAYGLKPGGDSGTFVQRWTYQASKLDASKLKAVVHGKNGHKTLKFANEYFLIPAPGVDSLVGEIAYAGVAAAGVAPSPGMTGKIVAFFVPGAKADQEWSQRVQPAAIAALTAGARGIVFILDPAFDAGQIESLAGGLEGQVVPAPVIGVRYDVALEWLKGSGLDLSAIKSGNDATPVVGTSVELRVGMANIAARPPNVVGILEGSDPTLKNTYVVYSAHMDHVGVGQPDATGDSIFNGADDDASGTSAVIELAQAFASLKERPKRSIIFLLVSGEEKGLFGSKYFVEHPPVPVEQMVANINIDMVGRNSADTTASVGGTFTSLGASTQAAVKAHPELKLSVANDLWPSENLFFRSDHFNFAMKKIPAIFFTSGLHDQYHKQSDHAELIDNDKLARTAQLVFWIGNGVANGDAPTWTPEGLAAVKQASGQ